MPKLLRRIDFLKCKFLDPSHEIRVAFSAILRIPDGEGKYVLIRNLHRPETFCPIGGVYKYYDSALPDLDALAYHSQVLGPGGDMSRDLRGFLPRGNLPKLLKWFAHTKDREPYHACLLREFKEELKEIGAERLRVPSTLKFRLVRSVTEGPEGVPGQTYTQFRLFDVYEIEHEASETNRFIKRLTGLAKTHPDLSVADSDEIRIGRSRRGDLLGHHCGYFIWPKRIRPESPMFVSSMYRPHTIQDSDESEQPSTQPPAAEQVPEFIDRRTEPKKKVAVVLKGGGAKGLAYIGALKELEKYYEFDWFVGTSAGAITASLLAVGYTPDELRDEMFRQDFSEFKDARIWQVPTNVLFRYGLYQGNALTNWLEGLNSSKARNLNCGLQGLPILMGDLKKFPNKPRLTIYACSKAADEGTLVLDSQNADTEKFHIAHAVRASVAIPIFFTPVRHFNMRVWDGGMKNNYPVKKLFEDNDAVEFIGLYLGSANYTGTAKPESWKSVVGDIFNIWSEVNDTHALRKFNQSTIIIDPHPIRTVDFRMTEIEKQFLLEEGRAAALDFVKRQRGEVDATDSASSQSRLTIERERYEELVNEAESARRIADELRAEIYRFRKSRSRKRVAIAVAVTCAAFVALCLLWVYAG